MSHPSLRALCLLFVTAFLIGRPAESRAVLLRGDIGGVITSTGIVPPGQFGLDTSGPFVNNGLPVSVRFWLDTDLLPPDQNSTENVYYEEVNPAADWLRVEIEVNGVVVPIDADYLLFAEARDSEHGDALYFTASDSITKRGLQVTVAAADFGFGPAPWTDLEAVDPNYYSPGVYSELYPPSYESGYFVDFQATSLSLHPVPEPSRLALLALAGSLLIRRRSV